MEGEAGVEDVRCDDGLGPGGRRGGRCLPVDGADMVAALGGQGGDVAAGAAGGSEDGDVHGWWISCSRGAGGSVGRFGCGDLLAGCDGGADGGLAAAVGGAQRDDGSGEQEYRAGQQGAVESRGERGSAGGVGGEQRAGAGGGDGGEDGQAEGGAQLLGGVQQAGREPGRVRGDAGVGGGGDRDQDGADPYRHDDQPGEQAGGVGAVDRDAGQVPDPGGGDQRAGDDHRAGADAGEQPGGGPGGDHDAGGDRQVGRAAADGAEAQHVLHVEGEEVEHRHERGERDHLEGVGGGQSPGAEDGEREQRVPAAKLDGGEGGQRDGRGGELPDRTSASPALFWCPDQGVDQEQH